MYATKNLQIIKLTEKDFLRTLENGIRYGAPVLLENIGQELDPSLEPVLLKQVFKRSGQMLLRLGDTDVPYSEEFKFLITTKLANPHYMPEICIKVTVINFTVTMKGLEDQLLVDVIKSERPDLEEKKDALVVSIADDQRQLREIEEQILFMLANASGNSTQYNTPTQTTLCTCTCLLTLEYHMCALTALYPPPPHNTPTH